MPKISITLILQDCVNSLINVKACLESIKKQTYKNLEAIIMNSTTSTELTKLCEEYTSTDNRFKLINEKFTTLNEGRNIGLRYVTGDYILFVDNNDYLLPTMVESSINIAKTTSSDIVIFEWLNKTAKGIVESPLPCKIRNSHQALLGDILSNRLPAYIGNKLYSTKLWQSTKFNTREAVDATDTIKAVCKKASNIFYLPQTLYVNSSLHLQPQTSTPKRHLLSSIKLASLLFASHFKLLIK